MADLDDVAAAAAALPEATEGVQYRGRAWSVAGKAFVWERAFSKADLKRFGHEPVPQGPIAAIRTQDLGEKEAILASHPAFFTIPHFDGYPAVLVRLEAMPVEVLREAVLDGWLACAPPRLAEAYLGRADP
jgi:hypothetical protein